MQARPSSPEGGRVIIQNSPAMKFEIVTAKFALVSALSAGQVPEAIVYVPEGRNRITPQSHPQGVFVNVPPEEGHAIARDLQWTLEHRMGENVVPWFDFEHARKHPASGYPKRFFYQPGQGIMCTVEWSDAGRQAISGRNVRYFSPEVLIDEHGIPCGFPERGPIGGLVTEPAFRNITPVAASDAIAAGEDVDDLAARCERDPAAYEAYCAALFEPASPTIEGKRVAARAALEEKSRDLVAAGVAATMDDALVIACRENNDLYERAFHGGAAEREHQQSLIAAGDSSIDTAWDAVKRRAEALVTAGDAASLDDGIHAICSEDPAAYDSYQQWLFSGGEARTKVRPETRKALAEMEDADKPTAKQQLDELAEGYLSRGEAEDLEEAKRLAYQARPDLYQQWRDDSDAYLAKEFREARKPQEMSAADGESAFEVEARKLVTAGLAASETEAFGIVAMEKPHLYEAYSQRFHGRK